MILNAMKSFIDWLLRRKRITIGDEERRPHRITVITVMLFLYLAIVMLFNTFAAAAVLKGLMSGILKYIIFFLKYLGIGIFSAGIEDGLFLLLYDIIPGANYTKSILVMVASFLLLYGVVYSRYDYMTSIFDFNGFIGTIRTVLLTDLSHLKNAL